MLFTVLISSGRRTEMKRLTTEVTFFSSTSEIGRA